MKAVILAGGKGTRLGEKTKTIPKPMVEVLGKPLLEYQIELCKEYGITEIILIVNHLSYVIEDYFSSGAQHGVNIQYYIEEKPLGTVGGIKAIESQLQEDFLVLYGDVMINMDLQRLIDFHQSKNSEATLVLHPNDHPYDSDLVEIDDNWKITAFHSKPHKEDIYYCNMVNAGAYLFSPKVLDFLEKEVKADFGKDIFPAIFDKLQMFGYNTPEYLKDMGTPDRLERVTKDWKSGKVEGFNLKNKRKAIFLDRDGVINYHKDYIYKPEQLELYPFIGEAVRLINQSDYLAIVTTNQPIIARNMTNIEGLKAIHNKMETELGNERVKFDAIYYCPHHPDKGFEGENVAYKVDCDCRKPKPGMILKACKAFNIDLPNSYMIGDTWRDIAAGKAAGVTTIGVMTGAGNKSGKEIPDYLFSNSLHAIQFIVNNPFKDIANKANEKYQAKAIKNMPFVISIGGNSRTGKSTLATYLKKLFEQQKKKVVVISLDNWIKSKQDRKLDEGVYERFQIKKIEKDVTHLFEKGAVTVENPYRITVGYEIEPVTYAVNNADIVIVEGVVTLGIEEIRNRTNYSIFINSDKIDHKARIFDFYKWKGLEELEIREIYEARKKDEYDIIKDTATLADVIIEPLVL